MLKSGFWFGALVLLCLPAAAEAPSDLALVCEGAMKGNWKVGSDGALLLGPNGQWQSGSASRMQYAEIPTVAEFRISAGNASMYLPQPPSCGICKGETGWRDVKKLESTEAQFAGKISYGAFSGTTFQIDRRTGRMTSDNGFDGTCRAIDLTERKF